MRLRPTTTWFDYEQRRAKLEADIVMTVFNGVAGKTVVDEELLTKVGKDVGDVIREAIVKYGVDPAKALGGELQVRVEELRHGQFVVAFQCVEVETGAARMVPRIVALDACTAPPYETSKNAN